MGYLNPLLTRPRALRRDAAEAGVDGVIVVDCPPEEAEPLADALTPTVWSSSAWRRRPATTTAWA